MFVDKNLLVSDAQVVCNSGSELSDGSIDLGVARNIAKGKPLYWVIIIDTSFATATSIDFQSVCDDAATLASGTILNSTGAIAIASLTAGRTPIILPVGDNLGTAERYIGLYYVLGGSNATAGAVTAFLAVEAQTN